MRNLVVWCPDWPVVAALINDGLSLDTPAVVLERNLVLAASAKARQNGVRANMRKREAQSRCPELVVFTREPQAEARLFEPVLSAIEQLNVSVAPIRPGLCSTKVSTRYRGTEENVVALIAEQIVAAGVWDCRFGIADDVFTAEQAARKADVQDCVIVPPEGSVDFLAPLPVEIFSEPELVDLLHRLGIWSVGDFVALGFDAVHTRFGTKGAMFHRLARALAPASFSSRKVQSDTTRQVVFEPPLVSIETLAFSMRGAAEDFIKSLGNYVCTAVNIELHYNNQLLNERTWLHSSWFSPADVVDRVRWQAADAIIDEGIDLVVISADTVEPIGEHSGGLWDGPAPDERVVRAVARVQSMLGQEAVVRPVVTGSRGPQHALVPFGEPVSAVPKLPWPGAIPDPPPAVVYPNPLPALVVGAHGQPIGVSGRGVLNAAPEQFRPNEREGLQEIAAWAGPWPIDELWWDEANARRVARFQIVGTDGRAWLMAVESGQWWTEASYD